MQIDFYSDLRMDVQTGRNIGEIDAQVDWQTLVFGGNLATEIEEETDEVGHTVSNTVMDRFEVWI